MKAEIKEKYALKAAKSLTGAVPIFWVADTTES